MKKIIKLTESDLTRIVRRVIREQGETTKPTPNNCSIGVCRGKIFKVNPINRLKELSQFIEGEGVFTQITTSLKNLDPNPPATVPNDGLGVYSPGTKFSFRFITKNPKYDIYVWQKNECIDSCPQIYLAFNSPINESLIFKRYSIMEDAEFNKLKNDIHNATIGVFVAQDRKSDEKSQNIPN